MPNSVNFTFG